MAKDKIVHEKVTNNRHVESRKVSQFRDDSGLWWNKDNTRSVEDVSITNNITRVTEDNSFGRFRRAGSRLSGSFGVGATVLGSLSFFFGIYIYVLLARKFLNMPFYGFFDFVNGFSTNVSSNNAFSNFLGNATTLIGLSTSSLSLGSRLGFSNVWVTLFDMFINLPYQLSMVITSLLFIVNVISNVLMTAVAFGQGVFNLFSSSDVTTPVHLARESLQNMWFGW